MTSNNNKTTTSKEISKINKEMLESERAKHLGEIKIVIKEVILPLELRGLKSYEKKFILRVLKEYGDRINAFRTYYNIGDTKLNACFSKNGLDESLHKSKNIMFMPLVISNLESILKYSIKIEEHKYSGRNIQVDNVHELLSFVLLESQEIIVIKITIFEYNDRSGKSIYSIANFDVIKKEISEYPPKMNKLNAYSLSLGNDIPIYNLTYIIKFVNDGDVLKYIPNELLTKSQIEIKEQAIIKYKQKHNQLDNK